MSIVYAGNISLQSLYLGAFLSLYAAFNFLVLFSLFFFFYYPFFAHYKDTYHYNFI